jgi:hypothetical protein
MNEIMNMGKRELERWKIRYEEYVKYCKVKDSEYVCFRIYVSFHTYKEKRLRELETNEAIFRKGSLKVREISNQRSIK